MSHARLRLAVAADATAADAAAALARREAADLLLLPRLATLAPESSDGAYAHRLGALAERHRLPLLFAYAEACSGLVHDAVQLVQADGHATANYRATHLGAAALAAGRVPGNWLTMARLGSWTLGFLAGIDHLVPEVARSLSAMAAQLLIGMVEEAVPVDAQLLEALARLRAIENGVAVCLVAAGDMAAADASGRKLAVRGEGGLSLVDLPVGDAATASPRRPELYRRLVAVD